MSDSQQNASPNHKKPQFSQLITEMLVSILLPTLILKKMSGADALGPSGALILALALPLGYGIYRRFTGEKFGFVPILGFISILLTGGIGLLELDPKYIAIKEAAIPLIIGVATLISLKTPYPLVKTFIYNDTLLQVDKVDAALASRNNTQAFNRSLSNATLMLAGSFGISAILNYGLARYVVTAPAGTDLFNDQLGTMNLLSYPVIALPSMVILVSILLYIFKRITSLTGLQLEDIVNQ